MAKSVAIILDGGFVIKKLFQTSITEKEIYDFALGCIDNNTEELFRIFFYHCAPYDKTEIHPITNQPIDFANSQAAVRSRQLLARLSEKNFLALRKGRLAFRGWTINKYRMNQIQKHAYTQQALSQQQTAAATSIPPSHLPPLSPTDFEPDFDQKEVDIKIGLDVAWLSSKHIVDKIILVTGDTDLIPAMKFARREGVQVVIVNIVTNSNNNYLKSTLKEHADQVRTVKYDTANGWHIV